MEQNLKALSKQRKHSICSIDAITVRGEKSSIQESAIFLQLYDYVHKHSNTNLLPPFLHVCSDGYLVTSRREARSSKFRVGGRQSLTGWQQLADGARRCIFGISYAKACIQPEQLVHTPPSLSVSARLAGHWVIGRDLKKSVLLLDFCEASALKKHQTYTDSYLLKFQQQ